MKKSLFIFGSLDIDQIHYSRISEFVTNKKFASIRGVVYELACGNPVLSLDGDSLIEGQIVEVDASDSLWAILDEFHGFSAANPKRSFFLRSTQQVLVNDFSRETCEVYAINEAKLNKSCRLIESGNWQEQVKKDRLADTLSKQQKEYIRRLSKAKGREIVPIDLALYRELMSLELIVDKGRRLALTRLGQEVSYFL